MSHLMADQNQLVVLIKPGAGMRDLVFRKICEICLAEYKYCLDAVGYYPIGYEIMGYFVRCPTCKIEGIADIGKYKKILENKMTEGASTRKSCPP